MIAAILLVFYVVYYNRVSTQTNKQTIGKLNINIFLKTENTSHLSKYHADPSKDNVFEFIHETEAQSESNSQICHNVADCFQIRQ